MNEYAKYAIAGFAILAIWTFVGWFQRRYQAPKPYRDKWKKN